MSGFSVAKTKTSKLNILKFSVVLAVPVIPASFGYRVKNSDK
jgi:hypothetical protein